MRIWLIALLAACGTTDPATPPDAGVADTAPFGVPTGDPITVTITPAGGTAISGDLTIVFPPGAVAAPTDVTIQPVTNTSFSPVRDQAYELSPNDIDFAQPVTLTFAAPQGFAASGESELVWISAQDESGYWHGKTASTFDPSTGAVSLAVTSFGVAAPEGAASARIAPTGAKRTTPWTDDFPYRLMPHDSTVDLKTGSVRIYENQCVASANQTPDELLTTCHPVGPNNSIPVTRWTIFTDSLAADGTLSPSADMVSVVYHAPNKDPGRTIQVWAHFLYANVDNILIANVDINCPWSLFGFGLGAGACTPPEWNGTSHMTQADGSVIDTTWTFQVDPTFSDGEHFNVKPSNGVVTVTKAPTPPPNCTLDIDPSHVIAPQEGQMVITITPSGDPMQPPTVTAQGQGITVWQATYTTHCPNGDGSQQFPFAAMWWPLPVGGAPPALPVVNGVITWDVSGASGTGTVTVKRAMPAA